MTGLLFNLDFCLSVGAQTFQNASPDRRGHGWLGANHAVGVDVGGIAAAKSLCMLDGAAHAHSAHKLIHRFRKWSAQEAHAWGMAKRCDAAAGADGNAATPQLVMALTCLVQANGGPTRLLSALLCGSNHGIDTCSRTAKALKRLLDSSQRLIVSHIWIWIYFSQKISFQVPVLRYFAYWVFFYSKTTFCFYFDYTDYSYAIGSI